MDVDQVIRQGDRAATFHCQTSIDHANVRLVPKLSRVNSPSADDGSAQSKDTDVFTDLAAQIVSRCSKPHFIRTLIQHLLAKARAGIFGAG
jgi:hypothetical protein